MSSPVRGRSRAQSQAPSAVSTITRRQSDMSAPVRARSRAHSQATSAVTSISRPQSNVTSTVRVCDGSVGLAQLDSNRTGGDVVPKSRLILNKDAVEVKIAKSRPRDPTVRYIITTKKSGRFNTTFDADMNVINSTAVRNIEMNTSAQSLPPVQAAARAVNSNTTDGKHYRLIRTQPQQSHVVAPPTPAGHGTGDSGAVGAWSSIDGCTPGQCCVMHK